MFTDMLMCSRMPCMLDTVKVWCVLLLAFLDFSKVALALHACICAYSWRVDMESYVHEIAMSSHRHGSRLLCHSFAQAHS
jgi:hypothetical protein